MVFVVNLMIGILFFLGLNVVVVCNDFFDYKFFEKVSVECLFNKVVYF